MPALPIEECVDNVVKIVIQTIEEQAVGDASAKGVDGVLTENEMKRWSAMFKDKAGAGMNTS